MVRHEGRDRGLESALSQLGRLRGRDGALQCLLTGADALLSEEARTRRRIEVMERAEREHGMPAGEAAEIHDIAVEERLDPSLAVVLVACGVAVRDIEPSPDSVHEELPRSLVEGRSDATVRRERRLRASFRRLRGLLERMESPEAALRAFVEDPDVGEHGY